MFNPVRSLENLLFGLLSFVILKDCIRALFSGSDKTPLSRELLELLFGLVGGMSLTWWGTMATSCRRGGWSRKPRAHPQTVRAKLTEAGKALSSDPACSDRLPPGRPSLPIPPPNSATNWPPSAQTAPPTGCQALRQCHQLAAKHSDRASLKPPQ